MILPRRTLLPLLPVLPLLLLLLVPSLAPAMAAELASPSGGWNRKGLVDKSGEAAVAYPFSPIERGAQTNRTMIKGRLAAAAGKRVPHQLVVNGNPTPLQTDAEGRYARPYYFGAGSNSVEIKTPDGKPVRRVQFYEMGNGSPTPGVRIVCAWDDPEAEIDMHVLTPDGQHAFWAHPVLSNGAGLDVDSVDGPGPEMFTMASPQRGNYHLYVNFWGKLGASGYHFDETTRRREVITARVTLVFNENTAREKRETFIVPLRSIGELTLVKSFIY